MPLRKPMNRRLGSLHRLGRPGASLAALLVASTAVVAAQTNPCGEWVQDVVQPDPFSLGSGMSDVVALDDGTAWAVGWLIAQNTHSAAWRFDGAEWKFAPATATGGGQGGFSQIYSIDVEPDGQLWVAGIDTLLKFVPTLHNAIVPMVARWTGTQWQKLTTPNLVGFAASWARDVAIVGNDDIWFVGARTDPQSCGTGLALHWDGVRFEVWDTPCVAPSGGGHTLYAAYASSPTDVWAVGGGSVSVGTDPGYILRFDGTGWRHVPYQAPGTSHALTAVVAFAPDEALATGFYVDAQGTHGYAVRWDGITWTPTPMPGVVNDLVAFGVDDVYGVGTNVHHWDGTAWTSVAAAPGEFFGVDANSACRMIAVGRKTVPTSPLFVRTHPTPANSTVLPGCGAGLLKASLSAADAPVLGETLVFEMDDADALGGLQPGKSFPWVALSASLSSSAPCGLPVPGWGVGGADGELLLDVGALFAITPVGEAWAGPGAPNTLALPLPHEPALAGLELYLQGLWFGSTSGLVLTNGLALTIGY